MLRTLRVRDLATISDVTLELGDGLCVLTGETGAGKSMLVDAIALLLGDRADRAAVRPAASRLVVEGEFALEAGPAVDRVRVLFDEAGLDFDEALVIRREVSRDGRSRAWVNGSPTTLTVIRSIAQELVDLHGQHQTIELAESVVQRDLLDGYAGALELRNSVRDAFDAANAIRAGTNALATRRDEAMRRADWLRHVVAEVDAARVQIGEDEAIANEASRLAQAGTLGEHAREAAEIIDRDRTGVRDQLGRLEKVLEQLSRLDPVVESWRKVLDEAWSPLDELSRLVAAYQDSVTADPERLEQLERRRDLLGGLMRKHGGSLQSVLDTRRDAASELELLDSAELDLADLSRRLKDAEARLESAASELSQLRTRGAEKLAGEVSRMLPGLGLPGARFSVRMEPRHEISADGAESVVFEASLNAGMTARPIATASSGGELSRLMLALKVAVTRHDSAATLVFDEIDQGIGGETGTKVAAALAQVATRHQVLVITHLAQIAARADHHLVVAKGTREGVATSDVSVLHGEDRVIELARMLGNADDVNARRLAAGMMRVAT